MHDKIKQAARARMAETGENYTTARRAVIAEHAALKAADPDPGRADSEDNDPSQS